MKIKSGRYSIEISNSDKILFGKSGITKADLINYYQTVAPTMLPYCDDRPISMQRFPNGIHHEGFFQKEAGDYFPEWITRISIPKQTDGVVHYVIADKPATLIYLANQGCITPHIWLSRTDNLNKPDRMIFDLDPADAHSFADVQSAAKKLKKVLDDCGLPTFCMLTGSRGAHVVVPLKRVNTFDETRAFAHDVAALLTQQFPDLMTINVHKNKRGKRIFVDWLRNGFGATTVAPYAVRAYEGAPIAMPVTWQKLLSPRMSSQKYTIKNAQRHINKVGDVWKGMQQHAVTLNKARIILDKLINKGVSS
ncbi:MAG TPA: non-homologous end-joining DNA ligase [Candidatus Babeliales bacterium]|jgi:bifunctional non-homologous end joining protein LigD|nr:non-homologous end-joining DNA ligase [Candidatus Babeliales bacterium]